MRIAYLSADPGVPVFGRKGCSIHVQEVVRALMACDAEVYLFAARTGGAPPRDLTSVPLYVLPEFPADAGGARERDALAANLNIAKLLARTGPFDLVYERYSLWSYAGMEYAQQVGINGVLEVNAPLIEEQGRYRALLDRRGAEQATMRAFAATSHLLAVSQEVAKYLEDQPCARGRVHVCPNAINPHRFPTDLTPSFPAPKGMFTVGFLGTLKPWHGLSVLVEAFCEFHRWYPSSRLLIVGDGPGRFALERDLASRRLRDATCLVGAVAADEVQGLLASMDAGLAPYPADTRFYFSPLKVFEYMAAGLPVIASRIGQLCTLIEDHQDGLLCPPGDPAAFADALGQLRRDPGLVARLGCAARRKVLDQYTWEAVARRILQLGLGGLKPKMPSVEAI